MFKISCNRFSRLVSEGRDRELTPPEAAFVSRHSSVCPHCEHIPTEADIALSALRSLALEDHVSEGFDDRVVKAHKTGERTLGFGYWSPALMGAAIAGIAVLCALTIVTRTADSPIRREPIGAAMRFTHGSAPLPPLNLNPESTIPR